VRLSQGIRRRGRTAIAVGCVALAALVTPAIAGTRTSASWHLTTHLSLKKVRDGAGPQQIRILSLAPGTNVPDIAPATSQYPMWSLTSSMSAHAGAIAGINGDFGTSRGQPKHMLMIDGELWTTGQSGGDAVAWSSNGKSAYIGHPALKILAKDLDRTNAFFVQGWNRGAPAGGSIQGYTSRGGTVTQPPGKVKPQASDPHYCAARLVPTAPIGWNGKARTSIVRRYKVDAQPEPCPKTPLAFAGVNDAVVVATSATSPTAGKITGLQPGDKVRLSFTFIGWRGVTEVMGAAGMLVKKGTNVAPPYNSGDNYIFNYNPRTAVGVTKGCSDSDNTTKCRLLFITIDGRQTSTGWSKGVRMPYLAQQLIRAGAYRAVNLDGGGSTTMWVKKRASGYCESSPSVGGCLAQRPSQSGGERATRSAIVVLPSHDAGTPSGLR
jgi:exopolysaccharide biosynthesis protein